jgi:hypothetical protein
VQARGALKFGSYAAHALESYRRNKNSVCIGQQDVVTGIQRLGNNAEAEVHDVDEGARGVVRCQR